MSLTWMLLHILLPASLAQEPPMPDCPPESGAPSVPAGVASVPKISGALLNAPLDPVKGELVYHVYGEQNAETIVLLHGLDSSYVTWDSVVERLSKKYRLVVYDLRGHGKSVARGDDYRPR